MFDYYYYEALLECLDKQKQAYQQTIKALQDSLSVFQKFDGKVINVRLEKALEEAIPDFWFRVKSFSSSEVTIEFSPRNHQHIQAKINICPYSLYEGTTLYIEKTTENRFIFEVAKKKINEFIESYQHNIQQIDEDRTNIKKIIEEFNQICTTIKQFNDKRSYIVRAFMKFDRVY
jgi:prefoldin subunit 5